VGNLIEPYKYCADVLKYAKKGVIDESAKS
jgi:hypothetical protein